VPAEHDLRGDMAGKVHSSWLLSVQRTDTAQNVLFRADAVGVSAHRNMDEDAIHSGLEQALKRLKARREASRPRPALDDKVRHGASLLKGKLSASQILTAWNGLMVRPDHRFLITTDGSSPLYRASLVH